ncbi:hypothetical protein BOX15_Mlig032423g1, partial [Macrostomum lignano]
RGLAVPHPGVRVAGCRGRRPRRCPGGGRRPAPRPGRPAGQVPGAHGQRGQRRPRRHGGRASKVQLNCHERENGYEFTYLPSAPGEYVITIKYGGNFHIVGSPFTAHVTGEAEPSAEESELLAHSALLVETRPKQAAYPERVICRGDALRQAVANQEMSFSVDASRAGYDMLLVGILARPTARTVSGCSTRAPAATRCATRSPRRRAPAHHQVGRRARARLALPH